MKKAIKSVGAWLFSLIGRKKKVQDPDSGFMVRINEGGTSQVYYLENLNQVATRFDDLKKTTLYNAFKGEANFPRTYTKGAYTVTEIK